MSDSTLVSFRKAIARHLAKVVGQPADDIFPLVQQNTSHRKASHSVFSVANKRLQNLCISSNSSRNGGGAIQSLLVDGGILERCCSELSAETREWVLQARRTKDMLLFDPQPLQLVRLAIGSIVQEYGRGVGSGVGGSGAKEGENLEEVLGKRMREETNSGSRRRIVIVDGVRTLRDENAFCCLRRVVLTGFVARFLSSLSLSSLSRGASEGEEDGGSYCVKVTADQDNEFLQGLDVETPANTPTSGDDNHLDIIKHALQSNTELKAQFNGTTTAAEDGAWVVDLSVHKLGQVKMFSSSSSSKEFGNPTAVVETMVSMARRFARYESRIKDENGIESEGEVGRYIWVVPDGRRLFAEQVLHLARIIFPGSILGSGLTRMQNDSSQTGEAGGEQENEPERKKRTGGVSDLAKEQSSWADRVEIVYYGPVAGVDLANDASVLSASGEGMSGIVEYTNVKMREVVEENRGAGGAGGYSGAYGDDHDGYDDDDDEEGEGGLDEEELVRMSKILSRSALVVACCGGKRFKKLNISLSRILDGKGNSGVFLQYVLSRLYGIERKAKTRLNPAANLSLLSSYHEALELSLLLAEYPDIIPCSSSSSSASAAQLDPFALVFYLFNLAAAVGQANRVLRVKGMEQEVAEARWVLFWAAKKVMEEGLRLLGLEFLERM